MTSLINPASKASAHVPAQPQQDRSIDVSKIAYQLPQPEGMISDTFVAAALDLDADERAWVPQSLNIAFRPLILNVSQGYDINILRVRASGVLSRHRHSGPVHALTLRGRWPRSHMRRRLLRPLTPRRSWLRGPVLTDIKPPPFRD